MSLKTGRILKGISGFYYVYVVESGIYECKAKGAFRKENVKPLVGDEVRILVISEEEMKGNVEEILPRSMELSRPPVANVDQALVIFAVKEPQINLRLLDSFLVNMEEKHLPTVICFNKAELATEEEKEELKKTYESAGYTVIFSSMKKEYGLEEIKAVLEGKLTTVAGPSGVGKSTIINALQSEVKMETDGMMKKMDSGKQTTRHSQLIRINVNSFIMDTPGFGSVDLPKVEETELDEFFPEMREEKYDCKFAGCAHLKEPDCAVKEKLAAGNIAESRYENYTAFYEELKNLRKRRKL